MKTDIFPSVGLSDTYRNLSKPRWRQTLVIAAAASAAPVGADATPVTSANAVHTLDYFVPTTTPVVANSVANPFERDDTYSKFESEQARLGKMLAAADAKLADFTVNLGALHARLVHLERAQSNELPHQISASLPEIEIALATAAANGDMDACAELLDAAADGEFRSEALLSMAKRAIKSEDPFARAAGARVIANNDSDLARIILPEQIALEESKTAKAIMTAALRSVSA